MKHRRVELSIGTDRPALKQPEARKPQASTKATEIKKKTTDQEPQSANVTQVTTAQPAVPFEVKPVAATPAPAPLSALPREHLEDPSLRVTINNTIGRVAVETPDGPMSLQVRVNDGIAEVRASAATPISNAHQLELRVALAKEGLSLGSFDMTQSDSRRPTSEPYEQPTRERTPRRENTTTAERTHDGHLSVTA